MTPAREFEGFGGGGDVAFFRALAKNNKKEWFQKRKAEFETDWHRPMGALITEIARKIDAAYPDCDLGEPKVFRIHRDVRFAKDKSPYKTNVSGVLPMASAKGDKGGCAAFYLQLGTESFCGAGCYGMSGEVLERYRAALIDPKRGPEILKIVKKLEKAGGNVSAMESLKNVPRGFDPEHPAAELLKRKGLVVGRDAVPLAKIGSRAFLDWCVAEAKTFAPLVRWLTFATA